MTPDGAADIAGDHAALARWVSERVLAEPVALEPIAPGLGHRAFLRVVLAEAPHSLILRVDPPAARRPVAGVAPEPPLEPIRAHLEAAGLPVPRSHGHDAERGLDLLEDLGDLTLEVIALGADAPTRGALYREAIDVAAAIQRVEAPAPGAPPVEAFGRRLDRALIATKARKVVDWLLPECLARPASREERHVVEAAFDRVADLVETAPAKLAHRDYKAANIHVRPGASLAPDAADADPRLALIDLQGAFMAPPEYDLVCLLRDSHVALSEDEVDGGWAHALEAGIVTAPAEEARLRFEALTVSRVGKDLAHYLDAARSRGDDRYLGFVATGLERMRAAAARLAEGDPRWRDMAGLVGDLPMPSRCAAPPSEAAAPCAR